MPPRSHQWSANMEEGEERVSRSQRKRESTALQELGEKLAKLAPAKQALLPLTPDLEEAMVEFRRISNKEAKRRHLQYIGRLMREAEADGVLDDIMEVWGTLE